MNDLDFMMGNQMVIMDALADLCEKAGLADTADGLRKMILATNVRLEEARQRRSHASANQK